MSWIDIAQAVKGRPSCEELQRRMDEKTVVALVAAILASKEWTVKGSKAYWGNEEGGDAHADLMFQATLDAIHLVKLLPEQTKNYGQIDEEEIDEEEIE